MQQRRTKEVISMRKLMTVATALAVVVPLASAGCTVRKEREVITTTRTQPVVQHDILVERPPMPAPRVEVRTVQPAPSYRWVDGHYEWNGSMWVWSSGYWAPN
jgi:hypothetical protein